MEQSPWETNSHSTSHEFLFLLWNSKVRYGTHKSRPLVPVQSTPSKPISLISVLILRSIVIFRLSGLFHSGYPTETLYTSTYPHACYTPNLSHPPWFDHPHNILWSVQVMKLLVFQSSRASHHFLHLCPNILFSTLLWRVQQEETLVT
jgi:hypothetical protein